MNCKHCDKKIMIKENQWMHEHSFSDYFYCNYYRNNKINSQLVATPIEQHIEKYELNNNFMEMLKAL